MNIDFRNLTKKQIGNNGFATEDIDKISEQLENAHIRYLKEKDSLGFTHLPCDDKHRDSIKQTCQELDQSFENVIVVGIGGSDLGARALHAALNHSRYNELADKKGKDLYFMGDTTDPNAIIELLDILDLPKSLFIIVSKSGNTIEPALAFVIIRQRIINECGENNHAKHFLILTDPESGIMREIAEKNHYQILPIPPDVGGRFSVLSSVGLVPLCFTPVIIDEILEGAKDLAHKTSTSNREDNPALMFAAYQYLYYNKGFNISVLMPYIYRLREFGLWFRQLWAESLGKKRNDGTNIGITPVAALGPTDQHSQLQLYNDGPLDKMITFIKAENLGHEITIPEDFQNIEDLGYLKGHKMSSILNQELDTTAYSLVKNQRPNCTITLPEVSSRTMGELIFFFELSVTYLGYLFDINAFDQPGVEMSKNVMYGLLGRKDYEKYREEYELYLKNP